MLHMKKAVDFDRCSSTGTDCVLEEDRISSLPDPILHLILTYLPLQTAVRTCLLSRRWSRLWTFIPDLSFSDGEDGRFYIFSVFKDFVDNTLRLYSSDVVNKFSLAISATRDYGVELHTWMSFAANHSVKEIDFRIWDNYFDLPVDLSVSSSLWKLSVECMDFWIPEKISWTSLRYLCISVGNLDADNDIMKIILLGCPVLEELKMASSDGISLDVSASVCMKKLVIHNFPGYGKYSEWSESDRNRNLVFRISGGASLRSFEFGGYKLPRGQFYLENLSSLQEAKVAFKPNLEFFDFERDLVKDNPIRDIVGGLCHVEKLSLNAVCFQVLSLGNNKIEPSASATFTRLRILVLTTYFTQLDVVGLASMLCSAPNLETLHIKLVQSPSTTVQL